MKVFINIIIVNMIFFTTYSYAYECNNRHYCNEMTSCDEARWVLKNCPDPQMDGDNDGWPCESDNLCGHHRIHSNTENPARIIFNDKKTTFNYFAKLKTNTSTKIVTSSNKTTQY